MVTADLPQCLEKGPIANLGADHLEHHGSLAVADGTGSGIAATRKCIKRKVVRWGHQGSVDNEKLLAVITPLDRGAPLLQKVIGQIGDEPFRACVPARDVPEK